MAAFGLRAICRRHHRMLHAGYEAIGELQYRRPGGSYVGATYPVAARPLS